MSKTDYLQLIPILTLTAYFFYVTYYYVIPMFRLKVLLFYAHIKYRGADIRFSDWKITMVYTKGGKEHVIERVLEEIDPTSRFFAMAVRAEFKSMLRDIRRGKSAATENENEKPTDNRGHRTEIKNNEENCD